MLFKGEIKWNSLISALNSEKGQEILQKLYDEVKAQNPNLTAKEWSKVKQKFMVSIFYEILKENPNFMSQFIGLVKSEIEKEIKNEN